MHLNPRKSAHTPSTTFSVKVSSSTFLSPFCLGSYGNVHLGKHLLTGERVAIKIVDKKHVMDVVREVEIWSRLRHPRIVRLYQVLATETKIYLVMELASRGEMLHWMGKSGKASEVVARRWFRQLVSAVAHLHERSIVHRYPFSLSFSFYTSLFIYSV